MQKRTFLAAALGSAGLLATGCATRPIEATQTLNGTEGAVVIKLITNGAGEFDPAEALFTLTLQRVLAAGEKPLGQDTAVLVRTRAATISTAVFSGMVRPGRYTLQSASGNRGGMTYTYPMERQFGSFEVRRGEVTLLGTLVVQPTTSNRFTTGYIAPEAELQATFRSLYPALAHQTEGRPFLSFDPDPQLSRRAALIPQIKRLASAWNGLTQSAEGEFLAGSKLGKVLWRRAGTTRWLELDVGTWREVSSVRPYRGGLLAAGEEGLLKLSDEQGRNWKTLNPPNDAFIAIAQPLTDGRILAFARKDRLWTAYIGSGGDTLAWQALGTFDDSASLNIGWKLPMSVALPNGAGIMLPNGDFHVSDGKTVRRLATGQSTISVTAEPDGSLYARVTTVSSSTLMSRDGGVTWSDVGLSRFGRTFAFKDASTGYAVSAISPGVFPGPYGLMTTHDGGKTWAHTGSPPGLTSPLAVNSMVVDRSDGALLAFLPDNAIVRSADEGRTWRIVKDLS